MCDLCDRSFSRKDRLKSHRKTHSGVPDLLSEAAGAFRQPAHHLAKQEGDKKSSKKAKRPRRGQSELEQRGQSLQGQSELEQVDSETEAKVAKKELEEA